MLLEGKNAVITGAGSGVGRARRCASPRRAPRSSCADLDARRAKETVRLIEAAGGTAVAVAADVSKEDDVVATIAAAVDALRPPRHHLQQRRHPDARASA